MQQQKNKNTGSFGIDEADSDQEQTARKPGKAEDEDKDNLTDNSIGILRLKVKSGRLTRDTETFGKMDPYVIVVSGKKKFKTKTHDKGGK